MDRRLLYYRLEPVYEETDARPRLLTAAVVTCLATGRVLAGMGGGGDFLSVEAVDALRRRSLHPGEGPATFALRHLRDLLKERSTDEPGPNKLRLSNGDVVEGPVADEVHEVFQGIIGLADDVLRLEEGG